MNLAKWRKRFIRSLRLYPLVALSFLAIAFSMGGFDGGADTAVSSQVLAIAGYILIGGVPILAIVAFYFIGRASDIERKRNIAAQDKLTYLDAFEVPSEEMHGYKLAFITGRVPLFTGLTGDTYTADASAICSQDANHTPPVAGCECGFYAFKDRDDAIFEHSITPGSFLLDVDLYGLGFVHRRGYRAESQVINQLRVPTRCMRCKVLKAERFVTTFKIGYNDFTWWQWQVRCRLCSATFKESDILSFSEMGRALDVAIS